MMASTMAALKREPGKIVMVSSVTGVLLSLVYSKPTKRQSTWHQSAMGGRSTKILATIFGQVTLPSRPSPPKS